MPDRRLTLPDRAGLRATLRPLTLGWGRFADDGWWRPFRTPDGAATLHIRTAAQAGREGGVDRAGREGGVEARAGEIIGEAWGPGAEWVLDRLPDIVGESDPGGFTTDHPLVRDWLRTRPSRFGRTGLVVEAMLYAILGQKVTGREAATGVRGVTRRFSEPAPGPRPGLWLPPEPERVAAAPYHAFHGLGIERRRADCLRRVAARAPQLERLAAGTPARAGSVLTTLPGVGTWTAAETVLVSHGDADAVSVGDFHVKHQVAWHLAGEERGTDERMLDLLQEFRPHRARVVRLIEALGPYPRRGPRLPVRAFAGW